MVVHCEELIYRSKEIRKGLATLVGRFLRNSPGRQMICRDDWLELTILWSFRLTY